ncbi:LacI family DNA-binding transcriptional regulator [Peribacillus sp. SCS-26]|uniref:LacI family DNA-binding transcriptional regulator n=1 Tax=Paraperibacillus marinus TaxID=3115295 RepID=UPI0039057E5D
MLTIKEIAEKANVSRTTVSRVLNDSGYVSEEARKRVLTVIEETGYVPSAHAKSLRTKKTKVIGVIVPKISTETSSRLVKGLDQVLSGAGYQILLAITNLEHEKEIQHLKLLKSRHVDGIILSATNIGEPILQEIQQLNMPFVMVGQPVSGLTNVVFDDYQAARDMMDHLITKGHKRIAFIGVDESDHAVGYLRKKGYLDALAENGLATEDSWIKKGIFDVHSGRSCMRAILEESAVKPTAVLTVTDRLAIGAMQHLKEAGIEIPAHMAIGAMGASELSRYITPRLSTIDFDIEEAGREAATMILEKIAGETYQGKVCRVKYRLLENESI